MRRLSAVVAALALGGLVTTSSSFAFAQSGSVTAEALFDQARALVKEGKIEEACPKFAESQRLDPAPGTLVYLADCHERAGRVATAWATFREAHAASVATGQKERAELAKKRADALEPLLPKLSVVVKDTPGVVVKRAGEDLGRGSWGVPLPVDPGDVTVTASAPGYDSFTKTVKLAKGEKATIEVPELGKPAATAPATIAAPVEAPKEDPSSTMPPADHGESSSPQKPIGIALMGVGAAGIVVGSIFGAMTMSTWSKSEAECPGGRCTQKAKDYASDASTYGTISTIGFVAGGILAAGGALLFFTAKPTRIGTRRIQVLPAVSQNGAGLFTGGTF